MKYQLIAVPTWTLIVLIVYCSISVLLSIASLFIKGRRKDKITLTYREFKEFQDNIKQKEL